MKSYWLGVVGDGRVVTNLDENLWWCVPGHAIRGDRIFMYCPRALSATKQGIFAECELVTEPLPKIEENYRCSGFGRTFGTAGSLRYVELKVIQKFQNPPTARQLKRDPVLKNLGFVRRNFQGTTFSVSAEGAERMLQLSMKTESNLQSSGTG